MDTSTKIKTCEVWKPDCCLTVFVEEPCFSPTSQRSFLRNSYIELSFDCKSQACFWWRRGWCRFVKARDKVQVPETATVPKQIRNEKALVWRDRKLSQVTSPKELQTHHNLKERLTNRGTVATTAWGVHFEKCILLIFQFAGRFSWVTDETGYHYPHFKDKKANVLSCYTFRLLIWAVQCLAFTSRSTFLTPNPFQDPNLDSKLVTVLCTTYYSYHLDYFCFCFFPVM